MSTFKKTKPLLYATYCKSMAFNHPLDELEAWEIVINGRVPSFADASAFAGAAAVKTVRQILTAGTRRLGTDQDASYCNSMSFND
jgi:hypothetical protein